MSNSFTYKDKDVGVGDRVHVIQKVFESGKERRQIFIGTLIKVKGESENRTVTVRRIGENKIGIEKIFSVNNPFLEDIVVAHEGHKGTRKAKIYYIRHKSKKEIDKSSSRNKKKEEKK